MSSVEPNVKSQILGYAINRKIDTLLLECFHKDLILNGCGNLLVIAISFCSYVVSALLLHNQSNVAVTVSAPVIVLLSELYDHPVISIEIRLLHLRQLEVLLGGKEKFHRALVTGCLDHDLHELSAASLPAVGNVVVQHRGRVVGKQEGSPLAVFESNPVFD